VGTSVSVVDAWTAGGILAPDPHGALARGLYLGGWGAPVVTVFAPLGVVRVAARSEGDTSRSIGRFAAVWGVVLFVGAAIATGSTSIRPFVPAVVVLSIPAGIGLSWLLERAVGAVQRDHLATGSLLILLLSLIVLQTAAVAVDGVYRGPSADANPVAPTDASTDRLGAVVDLAVHAAGKSSGSPDVRRYETAEVGPADSLQPLPWYFAAGDATVATADDAERLGGERPPVVVAPADRFETLEPHLGGYVAFPVRLPRADGRVIVFVRADLLPRDRWKTTLSSGPAGS
jgi:predicted membrane-bound mannosyltransferase